MGQSTGVYGMMTNNFLSEHAKKKPENHLAGFQPNGSAANSILPGDDSIGQPDNALGGVVNKSTSPFGGVMNKPVMESTPKRPATQNKNLLGSLIQAAADGYDPNLGREIRTTVGQNVLSGAMDAGDYQAAAQAAFQMGNVDGGLQLQGADRKQREAKYQQDLEKYKTEAFGGLAIVDEMLGIPDPVQRHQWAIQNAARIKQITGQDVDPNDPRGYDDGTLQGFRAQIQGAMNQHGWKVPQAAERKIIEGADGYQYYQDDESRVLPNVVKAEKAQWQTLTPEQVKQANLDPSRQWQISPDKKIVPIEGGMTPAQQAANEISRGRLDLDERKFEAEQSGDGKPDLNSVLRVGDRFSRVTADYRDIDNSMRVIEANARRQDAAGDLALLVSFTKILDPGSVAREGEVALTQSAAALADQAAIWVERLQEGNTLLPPELRADYLESAREMHQAYTQAYDGLTQNYIDFGLRYGMKPEDITMSRHFADQERSENPEEDWSDGDIVENEAGEQLVLQNGQWEKL